MPTSGSMMYGQPMGLSLETGGNANYPDYLIWLSDHSSAPYFSPKETTFNSATLSNIRTLPNGVRYDPNQTYRAPAALPDLVWPWVLIQDTSGSDTVSSFTNNLERERVYVFMRRKRGTSVYQLYRTLGRVKAISLSYSPSFEDNYIQVDVTIERLQVVWDYVANIS